MRSDPHSVNLGVPQGSVLGPLLFCLYINDIKSHLPTTVQHLLYADDLQVYCQVPPEKMLDTLNTLTITASNISYLADSVSLRLKHEKAQAIYFGSSIFVDRLNSLKHPGITGTSINNP